MVRLFRKQLALLDTVAADVAVLKRAQDVRHVERPGAPVEEAPRPRNAFYRDGAFWQIAYKGQTAPPIDDR